MSAPTKRKPPKKAATTRPAAADGPADGPADKYSDKVLAEISPALLPPMRDFHQLDRRRRAQLVRAMTDLLPRLAPLEALIQNGADSDALVQHHGAEVMELLADVEDLLAIIAVDPDSLRIWAGTADDVQLLAVFLRFAETFDSGEASSSSS